jgi:hypothetical protein
MAAALVAVMLGGIALSSYSCKGPTMVELEMRIFEQGSFVVIEFEDLEVRYYDEDVEAFVTVSLSADDTEAYREYVTGFCDKVFRDRREYEGGFSLEAVYCIWTLTATYEYGSTRHVDAQHGYPDDWDEFLERTNTLIGFDCLHR